jgi:hypothetical protein
MKQFIGAVAFYIFATAVGIALILLGAWLDSMATGEPVVIKKEKYVTCAPIGKGWSKCETEWI